MVLFLLEFILPSVVIIVQSFCGHYGQTFLVHFDVFSSFYKPTLDVFSSFYKPVFNSFSSFYKPACNV